jgi:hypothetical protein
MDYIVNTLVFLGLTTPITRAIFGATLGFLAQHLISPSISYYTDSETNESLPKTFTLLADKQDKNTTYIPWYAIPVITGLAFGLFL